MSGNDTSQLSPVSLKLFFSQHYVVRVRISVWAWLEKQKEKEKTIFFV
jgi:hypothetical protein